MIDPKMLIGAVFHHPSSTERLDWTITRVNRDRFGVKSDYGDFSDGGDTIKAVIGCSEAYKDLMDPKRGDWLFTSIPLVFGRKQKHIQRMKQAR